MALIPNELLEKSEKILFVAHLAIGDFTYLQNFFKAFSQQYPHIKMDLWIEEGRRTNDERQWPNLKKYSLYDWVKECDFFNKVYCETYRPDYFERSINEAQNESYPIVVSIATIRPHYYAELARKLSPNGFIAGMDRTYKFYQKKEKAQIEMLDVKIHICNKKAGESHHISDVYAYWFEQIADIKLSKEAQFPFVNIPQKWRNVVQSRIAEWEVKSEASLVFINAFAKNPKRCWTLPKVMELIKAMKAKSQWKEAVFIVNSVPEEFQNVERITQEQGLDNVQPFSALANFFELPAMLAECNLIISVETAVMHLANAVHVPVIALMRQKTPEWVPIDHENSTVIFNQKRWHRVHMISVDEVLAHLPE